MIVCPTCSSLAPDGAITCSTCGSPLGGATAGNRYPLALPVGTKLNNGSFSVGRVLGQGGFGITYKGNDINLARLVAIKELFPDGARRQGVSVIQPHNVSPSEWDSARREAKEEAQTIARFRHPGIVNVYSVWEENGTAYQAMEFLDGHSVGGLVEKGKLSEAEALTIIERVVDALDTLHTSGFIHRDLKPDNIVRTNNGRTVLIDFGTAKQFVHEKTQKLNPVLTPGYAPLEQYSSQARFDHRLDIYALGATLYHLLTGEIPISAVERAAGVDLPSVRSKNSDVSVAVSKAVERAMAVKVGERFDSAREFAKALRTTERTPIGTGQETDKSPSLSQIKGSITSSQLNHLSVFGITRNEAKMLSEADAFAVISHMGTSSAPLFSDVWKEDARKFFTNLQISSRESSKNLPPASAPALPKGHKLNPYLSQIRTLHEELKKVSTPPTIAKQNIIRLDEFFKRSVIEGFLKLDFIVPDSIYLQQHSAAKFIWRSRFTSYSHFNDYGSRTSQRKPTQEINEDGDFLISQSQFWLSTGISRPGYSLKSIIDISIQNNSCSPFVLLTLSTRSPLKFVIEPTQVEVTIDDLTRTLLFDAHDVVAMLRRLVG